MSNNENTIIFTMARMNPPTPGHLYLIKKLIDQAINMNVNKIFLILSKTNDNSDDPIPCDKSGDLSFKVEIIEDMVKKLKEDMIKNVSQQDIINKIKNMQVICRCVPIVPKQPGIRQPTPFTPLYNIIYNDYKNASNLHLFMIIGEDRASLLDNVTENFFRKISTVHSIDGVILPREGMSEYKNLTKDELENLNITTVPINAFSASFVRKLVKYGLKDKFTEIYNPYLNENEINALYDTILRGVQLKDPKKKKDTEVDTLKNTYPLSKTGGKTKNKKIKRKIRKTCKKNRKTRNNLKKLK
jgi:nicotinic acid mononucleotide adenylyltransferase